MCLITKIAYIIPILREFVYYRHPGPRREWKGGSEQQSMTPLPADPADPLNPLGCAKWALVRSSLKKVAWEALGSPG